MPFTQTRFVGPTTLTTSASSALYTVATGYSAVIKQIVVTNTTANQRTFTIYVGSTASASTAIFSGTQVAASDSVVINTSQVLNAGDKIFALADANSAVNLTISGVVNDGPLTPNSTYLADNQVTTNKIAANAVTQAKLSSNLSGTTVTTSTTRSTDIPSPFEGQMCYETDTDMLAIWNGSAWRYIAATTPTNGTVLQVVHASYSTQTTTSSSTYADTGLSVTITPKSTSSKVLISVAQQGILKLGGTSESACSLRLVRGSTTILQWGLYLAYTGSTASNSESASTVYLDSPSTTSATTYKTTFATTTNGSGTIDCQRDGVTSTIVAMEIAG